MHSSFMVALLALSSTIYNLVVVLVLVVGLSGMVTWMVYHDQPHIATISALAYP